MKTTMIYLAEIWSGDFKSVRIFTTKKAAQEAVELALKNAEKSGDYISDTAVVEMALCDGEFINTYSNRPEF